MQVLLYQKPVQQIRENKKVMKVLFSMKEYQTSTKEELKVPVPLQTPLFLQTFPTVIIPLPAYLKTKYLLRRCLWLKDIIYIQLGLLIT